jgi:hypothetical protein
VVIQCIILRVLNVKTHPVIGVVKKGVYSNVKLNEHNKRVYYTYKKMYRCSPCNSKVIDIYNKSLNQEELLYS